MQELGIEAEERNYAKKPLTRKEIEEILAAAGSVAAVLNVRHKMAKELSWKDRPPPKKAFISRAIEDNNLLRRPILIRGGKAVIGKDEAEIRSLLA